MRVMDETTIVEEVRADTVTTEKAQVEAAYISNEREVRSHNLEAMRVDPEALEAFLDLLAQADAEYLAAEEYIEPPLPGEVVDWGAISTVLAESQQILIAVQKLLSQTLADMGIPDHASIRVYADEGGFLRLLVDHPRQEEIEAGLNSPENAQLRSMYQAATNGMSMAGGLVGQVSVPEEVMARVKAKYSAA